MQTFLPYPDFAETAKVLDNRRLGKQRVECLQILKALRCGPTQALHNKVTGRVTYRKTPWYNHPAVQMWRGHEKALTCYGIAICNEWRNRGFQDNCLSQLNTLFIDYVRLQYLEPLWLGDARLHQSHRNALVHKDPAFYGPLFPDAKAELNYFWPTRQF